MDIIASYTEKKIKSCRKFELFEDEIVLHINFLFGPKAEITVPLKDIKLSPDKNFIKAFNPLLFLAGSVICIISFFLMITLMDNTKGYSAYIFPAGLVIFIIMILMNPKRDEYSSFNYHSGTPAFDIGCIGKQKKDYSRFVELIKKQITKTSSNTQC